MAIDAKVVEESHVAEAYLPVAIKSIRACQAAAVPTRWFSSVRLPGVNVRLSSETRMVRLSVSR